MTYMNLQSKPQETCGNCLTECGTAPDVPTHGALSLQHLMLALEILNSVHLGVSLQLSRDRYAPPLHNQCSTLFLSASILLFE